MCKECPTLRPPAAMSADQVDIPDESYKAAEEVGTISLALEAAGPPIYAAGYRQGQLDASGRLRRSRPNSPSTWRSAAAVNHDA
jgi:hypothetical protein